MRSGYRQGQPTVYGMRLVSPALTRIRILRHFAREQARRESCRTCWGRRTIMSWRTAKDFPCSDCAYGVTAGDHQTFPPHTPMGVPR